MAEGLSLFQFFGLPAFASKWKIMVASYDYDYELVIYRTVIEQN